MGLDDISAENLAGTDTAVIWSLRGWVTVLGPTIWPAINIKDCVFLLQTEPGLMLGIGLHQTLALMTVVELVGSSIRIPGLGHDEDVVATSKRIGVDSDGANVDIGVVAWSLAGG